MAHHGYIPVACEYLKRFDRKVTLLEIGVDRGQTLIPMLFWLTHNKREFHVTSVDIQLDPSLEVILQYTGLLGSPYLSFHVENSLDFLGKQPPSVYDVVFLDGDHNYYTVSRELSYLLDRVHSESIIIVDDYEGRWSERDLFYAERESHKDNKIATQPQDTEKHGVKAAIDDFLTNNPGWDKAAPIKGEPVILFKKKDSE